jgi:hypothetical protein
VAIVSAGVVFGLKAQSADRTTARPRRSIQVPTTEGIPTDSCAIYGASATLQDIHLMTTFILGSGTNMGKIVGFPGGRSDRLFFSRIPPTADLKSSLLFIATDAPNATPVSFFSSLIAGGDYFFANDTTFIWTRSVNQMGFLQYTAYIVPLPNGISGDAQTRSSWTERWTHGPETVLSGSLRGKPKYRQLKYRQKCRESPDTLGPRSVFGVGSRQLLRETDSDARDLPDSVDRRQMNAGARLS